MERRDFLKLTSAAGLVTLITPTGVVQAFTPGQLSGLEANFLKPPLSAGPYTMWMWMNGQVTKEGITLDLEAIARVGLGGVFNFDAGTGIPKGPLKYLSAEWFDAKAHAFKEAERLGLEYTMHNCPGWSSSGGPWITPELSMKQLTWSKAFVTGAKNISQQLTEPKKQLDFYKDAAVLAYPSLKDEATEKDDSKNFEDWKKRTNQAFSGTGFKEINTSAEAIDTSKIIDITSNMDKNGLLNWNAPAGNWTILRIGYTSHATMNVSAPDTGVGLECDKYDAGAIAFHFNKMMTALLPSMSSLAKKGKMGLEIDSFEVGMQNWTGGFENEFKKRNGYGLLKYLPAMTGKLVDDADTTERFLWDLRRTQADLLADNYYGKFNELCSQHGISSYFEPYDRGPMEEMQIGARGDGNMGEYWNGLSTIFQNNLTMRRTCKLASSIAHVNGQRIAGVEGLTGEPGSAKWQEYAFAMKPVCDHIYTQGINRIVVHRYAHQPHPTAAPGMTMGPWGIQFDRTNTMWEPNKAWLHYLARCQSILQQGLFVADLAYFTGEDPGVYSKVNRDELFPSPPAGYDYDIINAEVLLQKATVVNGRLVLDNGMSYRVLVLQQQKTISLTLLQKIYAFITSGLIVVGARPVSTPGLKTHSKESEETFKNICAAIWNEGVVVNRKIGKGHIFWGQTMQEVFSAIDLQQDFKYSSRSGDAPLKYIHRSIENAEVYFVANQRRTKEELLCSFRIKNKMPELWDAQTGKIITANVFTAQGSRMNVALTLEPYGSVFVVFRKALPKDNIVAITRNNVNVISAKPFETVQRKLYPDVKDNFTIAFRAKPEMEVMISDKAFYEAIKGPWTDFYTIYPPPGETLYGAGHSTCGITVGRNGVAVWEHGNSWPQLVLGCAIKIAGCTDIALVYENGIPSVYVNGSLVKKGEKQGKNIHPGIGHAYLSEGASYYNGDMTEPELFNEPYSEEKIRSLAAKQSQPTAHWNRIVEPVAEKNNAYLFWQNGAFTFETAQHKIKSISINAIADAVELNGSWLVMFPPNKAAPAKIELPELISLKDHSDDGVKYFSGTATYHKEFIVSANAIADDKKLFIDLGRVEVMAELIVNGMNLGILWTRPYLAEITHAVKAGANTLEIKVTNQWVNRLIGDEQLPEVDKYSMDGEGTVFAPLSVGAIVALPAWYQDGKPKPDNGRVAFSTWKHYQKDSPLLESGLIGPVMLRSAVVKQL